MTSGDGMTPATQFLSNVIAGAMVVGVIAIPILYVWGLFEVFASGHWIAGAILAFPFAVAALWALGKLVGVGAGR